MSGDVAISAATVISLLATALAGIAVFFVKRYIDKLEKLDAEAVRKRELKELEERLTQDQRDIHERLAQGQRDMHEQNRASMTDIRNDIRALVSRIDGAFNRGGGR